MDLPSPIAAPIVVVDCETTGLTPRTHEIVSVAFILCDVHLEPLHTHSALVRMDRPHAADPTSLVVSGYIGHEALWSDAISQQDAARLIAQYTRDRMLLAHNVDFDRGFLAATLRLISESPRWKARQICTLKTMRTALKSGKVRGEGASLQASCARFSIHLPRQEGEAHFAADDAEAARKLAKVLVGLGCLRII